jgi:diguanylate cyclase (GGDEF)-like protein
VISLKKYLDLDPSELKKLISPSMDETLPDDLLASACECYRSALTAMGASGTAACPALGGELHDNLASLAAGLSGKISASNLRQTETLVEEQLQKWGERTAEYCKHKANEAKELLIVLARTLESLAERDQRHSNEFSELTSRLQAIADLEDLTQIRSSLMRSATELKTCAEKMAFDRQESVAELRKQLATYQINLLEAELTASQDPLTGLENRRSIQRTMEHRIMAKRVFCVAMLDLNGFKQVNDLFGHAAGDDLLRQFATELRANMSARDVVCRWGGDEFVVVMDCTMAEAAERIDRLHKWAAGDYTVRCTTGDHRISLKAAIGVAQWQPGDTMQVVLGQADRAMYRRKAEMRNPKEVTRNK